MTSSLAISDLQRFDEIEQSFALIGIVLRRWHAGRGEDTAFIAEATGLPESEVARIIAADQNRRHAMRLAASA